MIDQRYLSRVRALIEKGNAVVATNKPPPPNTIGFPNTVQTEPFYEWRNQSLAFLTNLLGPNHVYSKNFEHECTESTTADAVAGQGILKAVAADLAEGYLATLQEQVHADLFSDFLEMADYLLSEGRGYKDAAAVLAGGVLEAHLRKLCDKAGIAVDVQTASGPKAKKAEAMNTELASNGSYSKLDQKTVTAWLDLRNNAAHARYDQYSKDQVALFVQGLRDFLNRYPA